MSFNRAGASKIVLIGRDESKLKKTQKDLSCDSSIYTESVLDEDVMARVAAAVGQWDVLILAAGYLSKPAAIKESSVDEWWQSFEVRGDSPLLDPQILIIIDKRQRLHGPRQGVPPNR